MKTQLLRLAFALALLSAFCSNASAWNCSDPLAARVPVPAGTSGTFGNGDGQLFLGTGSEGVKGQLYECKVPTPDPTPKSGVISKQKQDQNQTQNQNQNQNQNQTATGGSVKDSGNSSSKSSSSSNSASNSTSSASNNGNGNGNGSNNAQFSTETNVEAPKIPVASALAFASQATVSCFKGFGASGQTAPLGLGFTGGKIDQNCVILEAARLSAAVGNRLAFCKIYITHKAVRKAGVTLTDCMALQAVQTAPVIIPSPVAPVPQITVNVPAPVVQAAPAPVAVASLATFTDLGSFRVNRSYSTGTCPTTKTVLGTAGITILDRAIKLADKTDGEIILNGNVFTAGVATSYLRKRTRGKVSIQAADDQDGIVNVKVWSEK